MEYFIVGFVKAGSKLFHYTSLQFDPYCKHDIDKADWFNQVLLNLHHFFFFPQEITPSNWNMTRDIIVRLEYILFFHLETKNKLFWLFALLRLCHLIEAKKIMKDTLKTTFISLGVDYFQGLTF